MQVKIGNGGNGGTPPVAVHLGGGGSIQSMLSPDNWIYIAGIVVLLIIVIGLIVLTIREYNLQKKKKK
jgi:hypothetical protein